MPRTAAAFDELVAKSSALKPVSHAALRAYQAAASRMIFEVEERFAAHPRYIQLMGDTPPIMPTDRHRYHVLFMTELLAGGDFDLLAATLPWLYHASRRQGVPYDCFAIELGLWRKVIRTSLPPEHAAPIAAIYDWLLAQHDQVVALAEQRSAEPGPETADESGLLVDALLDADAGRVMTLCRELQRRGTTLPDLLCRIVWPAMHRIGALWEEGRIRIGDEHQATAAMNRTLAGLYFEQRFPPPRRGTALVAACINEYHEMGAWMVATCLELDGWDLSYLGANTPAASLLAKAERERPDLIALSVSMPFNLSAARKTIAALRERLPSAKILVGGQVFALLPRLGQTMGADACLPDCIAAMRWAEQHCTPRWRDATGQDA